MKLPNNNQLLAMTHEDFASWIRQAVNRREFRIMFEALQVVCAQEVQAFDVPTYDIKDIVSEDSYLYALSQIYQDIAPLIRQAINNKILMLASAHNQILDTISIVYIAYATDDPCPNFNCAPDPRIFIFRNGKKALFWQWFRAHLPYHYRLALFRHDFNYPMEFVLPSILISNPYDLQFYKVFCREIKAQMPELYRAIKISSQNCKKMIERLKIKAEGGTPPPQAVTLEEADGNFLVLDILR